MCARTCVRRALHEQWTIYSPCAAEITSLRHPRYAASFRRHDLGRRRRAQHRTRRRGTRPPPQCDDLCDDLCNRGGASDGGTQRYPAAPTGAWHETAPHGTPRDGCDVLQRLGPARFAAPRSAATSLRSLYTDRCIIPVRDNIYSQNSTRWSNKGWDVGTFGHSLSAGGVGIIYSNIPDALKASVCAERSRRSLRQVGGLFCSCRLCAGAAVCHAASSPISGELGA